MALQTTDATAQVFELWRGMMAEASAEATIDEFRVFYDAMFAKFEVDPAAEVTEVDADGVRCLSVTLSDVDAERDVIFFHGGGYMCGNPEGVVSTGAYLARACRAKVLLPDYRLAPENAHPAAHEDAVTVIRWVLANGGSADKLAIIGDSAGGGLALSTIVTLREAGEAPPAAIVAWSPWIDMEVKGSTLAIKAEVDPIASQQSLEMSAQAYLQGQDPTSPTANVLCTDLTGFPPTLVQVGGEEVLLDDSLRFAQKAAAAGVDVYLDVAAEMPHVYHYFASFHPIAKQSIEDTGNFVIGRTSAG